jgi:homoserine O-acetyltransferase
MVVCGSARTAEHKVFLSGLLRTFEAAHEHLSDGRFSAEPHATLRAIGHIYAGWALSQDFYRGKLHLSALGAPDLDTYLRNDWEKLLERRRAANCYAQLGILRGKTINRCRNTQGFLLAAKFCASQY